MSEKVMLYKGRRVDSLSREELIEAVEVLGGIIRRESESRQEDWEFFRSMVETGTKVKP